MGYRTFRDSAGIDWGVWDVVPQLAERRGEDRRQSREPIAFTDRRRGERRLVMSRRAVMAGNLMNGWLCFECDAEKRRLIPIPEDWERCDDSQLEGYCRMAHPVRRPNDLGASHSGTE